MVKSVSYWRSIPLANERHNGAWSYILRKIEQLVAERPKMSALKAEFFFVAKANMWVRYQLRIKNWKLGKLVK